MTEEEKSIKEQIEEEKEKGKEEAKEALEEKAPWLPESAKDIAETIIDCVAESKANDYMIFADMEEVAKRLGDDFTLSELADALEQTDSFDSFGARLKLLTFDGEAWRNFFSPKPSLFEDLKTFSDASPTMVKYGLDYTTNYLTGITSSLSDALESKAEQNRQAKTQQEEKKEFVVLPKFIGNLVNQLKENNPEYNQKLDEFSKKHNIEIQFPDGKKVESPEEADKWYEKFFKGKELPEWFCNIRDSLADREIDMSILCIGQQNGAENQKIDVQTITEQQQDNKDQSWKDKNAFDKDWSNTISPISKIDQPEYEDRAFVRE